MLMMAIPHMEIFDGLLVPNMFLMYVPDGICGSTGGEFEGIGLA